MAMIVVQLERGAWWAEQHVKRKRRTGGREGGRVYGVGTVMTLKISGMLGKKPGL